MLSNVADLSQVLSDMARNGHPVTPDLVASTSSTPADISCASDNTRLTWSIYQTRSTHSRSSLRRLCDYFLHVSRTYP